jgi:16S rRNA (cytosine967-C5)-methyltransferase
VKRAAANNPRQLAVAALSDVLDRGQTLTESPALNGSLRNRDLSMSRHLAYGVLRWLTALEWLADQLLVKPIRQRDRDVRRLILIGLYQLWQDDSPAHAAINETTECARLLGKPWAVGMINAVLRRFQREGDLWLTRLGEQDEHYAHPPWLLEKLRADWPRNWRDIVAANNEQARMWLRVNSHRTDRQKVSRQLEDQGFEVHCHPSAIDAVSISPAVHVNTLSGFNAGHFSVQDPAAQLAADLLDVTSGMRVLDACAAPGGKTCHLLERTPGAVVTAVDLQERRLQRLRDNLQRLQLQAQLIEGDATRPETWWDGAPFQRILLDAPCSASGVIRRHPEIKHLRQPGQIQEAASLQRRLLQQLWPLLEPGGILVYATCSVFHDENSRQINNFFGSHEGVEEVVAGPAWGHDQQRGRQILPGEQDMDGFYYAVLRKSC